ncbi:ABC transporter permease [Trueperella bialowiezensis]|uniref:Acidobacterial duplicated orphan permease n=1 Tax=Trueperella bialowiezensis TaxID=312285 RepID=A0A3S4Z4Y0_9ACTO|nr:ABC transporter permease [Trueperella bialowiezensis]VEI13044.1 acidobacterial duplicated orphan permease [Trueperella bialowiezensis]
MNQSLLHTGLLIFTILVATMAVVLQYGQASNRVKEIQETFHQPEFRTVELVDERESYPLQVDRMELPLRISAVQRVWSLSPSFDVKNPVLPDRGRFSAVYLTGDFDDLPITLTSGRIPNRTCEAIAPRISKQNLGLDESGGLISTAGGQQFTVVGYFEPEHKRAPQSILVYGCKAPKIRSIWLEVEDVDTIDKAVTSTLKILELNPATTSISKSEAIAEIGRKINDSQQNHTILTVGTALIVATLIVSLISAMMVNSRKVEFGRRRALGASRKFLLGLVTVQIVLTVALAAILGIALAAIIVAVIWPLGLPTPAFCFGLAGTLVFGSIIAQTPSAILAAFRDPVEVLRTP